MPSTFPKLLVVTECSPNAAGGGAAVIRQMLREWPADRLFWWSCFPDRDRLFDRQVAAHRVARIPAKLYPSRRWCRTKTWWLEKIWLPWATGHFRNTLKILKPDAVWVIPHAWSIPPVTAVLPQSKIGFHVSLHDYADVRGNVIRFGAERCRRLAAMADQLYASAVTRDAICQPMLDDLRARTGRDGVVARAGLEQSDFDWLSAPSEKRTEVVRIGYAGTILVENEFVLLVRALARIRPQLPQPVRLDFFGNHSYQSRGWFDAAWMQEHGNLAAAELAKALRQCTWGFAPMGLVDDDPRYNRFSLPTKFVSYLAAGLPIITLGHPESSVVRMATTHNVGLCLTTGNLEDVSAQLLPALSDPRPEITYADGIRRCAEMEFDTRRMRAALYDGLRQCAASTRTGPV